MNILVNQEAVVIYATEGKITEFEGNQQGKYILDEELLFPKVLGLSIVENVILPTDYKAHKYLYIDGVFSLNESYEEPISDEELLLQTGDEILEGSL